LETAPALGSVYKNRLLFRLYPQDAPQTVGETEGPVVAEEIVTRHIVRTTCAGQHDVEMGTGLDTLLVAQIQAMGVVTDGLGRNIPFQVGIPLPAVAVQIEGRAAAATGGHENPHPGFLPRLRGEDRRSWIQTTREVVAEHQVRILNRAQLSRAVAERSTGSQAKAEPRRFGAVVDGLLTGVMAVLGDGPPLAGNVLDG